MNKVLLREMVNIPENFKMEILFPFGPTNAVISVVENGNGFGVVAKMIE